MEGNEIEYDITFFFFFFSSFKNRIEWNRQIHKEWYVMKLNMI